MGALAQLVFCKRGQSSIWIQPELATDTVIDTIANPDALLGQPECEIIKDQPKIKVGCLQVTLDDRPLRLYIKRYNVFSWRHKLGSLFIASGAVKSMRGAGMLLASGVGTAKPVAAVEQRHGGILTASFYLTEEVAGGKISSQYWREDLQPLAGAAGIMRRRAFVSQLAKLFAKLHDQNVYHNDLKDFNILLASKSAMSGESFAFLDLEGVRQYYRLGRRRRIKNIVQLNRTLGQYVSRTDALRFLKIYLGAGFASSLDKRSWIAAVLQQTRELDRQKMTLG